MRKEGGKNGGREIKEKAKGMRKELYGCLILHDLSGFILSKDLY